MSVRQRTRRAGRLKRKRRVRKKVHGSPDRPRLTVFRSNRYIYAQVVNDDENRVLVAASSLKPLDQEIPEDLHGKCATAYSVGRRIAALAKDKGIEKIVFDRNGYLYHGRVAALARGIRDGGIAF
jgi:large subunit ribosomal protein L18